jgi:hypothetical protein
MQLSKPRITAPLSKESGATLIVCLVILTILTFLGVNSMTDSGLQSSMVRNNQLRLMAYNTALSEINAQIDDMNLNFNTNTLLDALTDSEGLREFEFEEILLSTVDHPFSQTLALQYLRSGTSWTGNEVGTFRELFFEIESDALLEGTGTRSDQVQGISYIAPN